MSSSFPSYPLVEARCDGLLPVHESPCVEQGVERRSDDTTNVINNDGNPSRSDVSQPESQREGQELREVSKKKGLEVVDDKFFLFRGL